SAPNIGYEVLSEKGQCFIGAFENVPDQEVGDGGTLPPDCLPQLRRMAAAAGVKLLDWTKPGGVPACVFSRKLSPAGRESRASRSASGDRRWRCGPPAAGHLQSRGAA